MTLRKTLILLLYVYIFVITLHTQAMNTRLLMTLDTYAVVGAMATKLLESAIDIRRLSTWVYPCLPNRGGKIKTHFGYRSLVLKKIENFKKSLF
jgi:hypothetical protein